VQPPEVPRSAPLSGKSNTRRPVPAAGWLRGVGLYGRNRAMRRSREPQQPADGAIAAAWSAATGAVPCDFAVLCAYAVRREPCGLFPAGVGRGAACGRQSLRQTQKKAPVALAVLGTRKNLPEISGPPGSSGHTALSLGSGTTCITGRFFLLGTRRGN